MGERYKKYEELANLFIVYHDRISVYKDKPDGNYLMKKSDVIVDSPCEDKIYSDGKITLSDDSLDVCDSSYVTVITYRSKEGKKGIESTIEKISVILSHAGYGVLQSILLSKGNVDVFYKLVSSDGFLKGNLEAYEVSDNNSFAIVPGLENDSKKQSENPVRCIK